MSSLSLDSMVGESEASSLGSSVWVDPTISSELDSSLSDQEPVEHFLSLDLLDIFLMASLIFAPAMT